MTHLVELIAHPPGLLHTVPNWVPTITSLLLFKFYFTFSPVLHFVDLRKSRVSFRLSDAPLCLFFPPFVAVWLFLYKENTVPHCSLTRLLFCCIFICVHYVSNWGAKTLQMQRLPFSQWGYTDLSLGSTINSLLLFTNELHTAQTAMCMAESEKIEAFSGRELCVRACVRVVFFFAYL